MWSDIFIALWQKLTYTLEVPVFPSNYRSQSALYGEEHQDEEEEEEQRKSQSLYALKTELM